MTVHSCTNDVQTTHLAKNVRLRVERLEFQFLGAAMLALLESIFLQFFFSRHFWSLLSISATDWFNSEECEVNRRSQFMVLDYVVFTVGVLTLLLQYSSQLLIFMVLGSYLIGIFLMIDDDDYLNNEINHWISHRIGIWLISYSKSCTKYFYPHWFLLVLP